MNYKNPFIAGHIANTGILALRSFMCRLQSLHNSLDKQV
jgi:hypothetical protein